MAKWLSDEWFDRMRDLTADQPADPGLSARIQAEVTGGPDGEIRYYLVLEDGRITDGGGGVVAEADVTVSLAWADAVAVEQGGLDPNVAFMQGRLKVGGSMEVMLQLLALAAAPASQELRRAIAEFTEF
jgi:putative sterol carrier protein